MRSTLTLYINNKSWNLESGQDLIKKQFIQDNYANFLIIQNINSTEDNQDHFKDWLAGMLSGDGTFYIDSLYAHTWEIKLKVKESNSLQKVKNMLDDKVFMTNSEKSLWCKI